MRIAFLCNSLEPGYDGVGDYTRLLAEECELQGHDCIIIALNDRHIVNTVVGHRQSGLGTVTLRLPSTVPWRERTKLAERQLREFDPEWISLRFVCYGFHPKGLVHGLASKLKQLLTGCNVHIMFHEVWIGAGCQSSLQQRLIGEIQRKLILAMVRALKPTAVQTSIPIYAAMLQETGIRAGILPLFGNIPVAEKGDVTWLWKMFSAAGCPITNENRMSYWVVGMFGTLHPEWQPEPFFGIIGRAAESAGKKICLLGIGRLGSGETRWEQIAMQYSKKLFFLKLGTLPREKISQCFHALDIGLATSPWLAIGKSGSVAAMLDHGVPVIVTRDDVQSGHKIDLSTCVHPLLHKCDPGLETKLATGLAKQPPRNSARSVAKQFLKTLDRVLLF